MKLTSRGFTLVELMIVIAIIGILAAALFPSMTGYLKRSRDAARASGMKDIATALGAYFADREGYPTGTGGGVAGCVGVSSTGILTTQYMPKGLPIDPTSTWTNNGCATPASYGYAIASIGGSPAFMLKAQLENPAGGNTGALYGAYVGSGEFYAVPGGFAKGAGSGYILTN